MKYRLLALGALSLFAAHTAQATTYFNTIAGIASAGGDGVDIADRNGHTVALSSFTAGSPDFSSISFRLADSTPGDGGSLMVFLVPDNGSGSVGVAGKPTINVDGSDNYVSFANSQYLGTIADSSLTSSFTVQSLWVSSQITTANDEYWVGFVWTGGSQATLSYEADDSGIGTAGQEFANTTGITGPAPDANGAYQLAVSTPEPASIALIGSGIAALGTMRRRRTKKTS